MQLATTQPAGVTPMDARRNRIGFAGDMASFGIGAYFIPLTTVLVGLTSTLTENNVLIGLVSMAWTVGYYLPQFAAAKLFHDRPRKKPLVVAISAVGRQSILVIAIWLWLTQAQQPQLTVWIIIFAVAVFSTADGLSSIGWFDLMANSLTPGMRARTTATGMLVGSIGSLVPALIIPRVLSPQGPPYPSNYAVLFFLAWLMFMSSFAFLVLLKERVDPAAHLEIVSAAARGFGPQLAASWKNDRSFRRMLIARSLTFIEVMASPFYVVFIKEKLGLNDAAIGLLSSAYVFGSIAAALVFGWVSQRSGPHRVAQLAAFMHAVSPLTAFAVAVIPALEPIAFPLFVLVMAMNGALNKQMMLGWIAYAMDISTNASRTAYIATLNTISGLISLTPALAGLLINALAVALGLNAAYAALFGVIGAVTSAGFLLTLRLPLPRRHALA